MVAMKELASLADVLAAIKKAKVVMVMPRFGCAEAWVELSKKAAVSYAKAVIAPSASPAHMEMYSGSFGDYDSEGEVVWLG